MRGEKSARRWGEYNIPTSTHACDKVDDAPEEGQIVVRRNQHDSKIVRHADIEKVEEEITLKNTSRDVSPYVTSR